MADTKNTQKLSPQGYNYGEKPFNENPWYEEDEEGHAPSELPIASKTQAGIVKIGSGVNVSDDGTISVEGTGGGGSAKTPVITASASVSDTVGTPAVTVTKTGTDEEPNFEFAFTNLKGERGEQGEKGEKGESITGPRGPKGDPGESIKGPQGERGEAGYSPTATVIQDDDGATITITSKPGDVEETTTATVKNGKNGENGKDGKDGNPGEPGKDGVSPTVSATGSTESGALAGTITGANGEEIRVYNGAKGQDGSGGDSPAYTLPIASPDTLGGIKVGNGFSIRADGTLDNEAPDPDISGLVSDVSLTNEDGVYTLSQEKGGTKTEIGTIEVPTVDTGNLLAEVEDSVVSNDAYGYDFHTIQETENNGTQNEVGKFYLAQNQITDISATGNQLNIKTINQDGTEDTKSVEMTPEVDLTNVVNDVKMSTTGNKYTIVQLKGDPENPTSTEVGTISVPAQTINKLESKKLTNYSAITAYVLNGNNNLYFATYDNRYGLTFSPIMDIDMSYDNTSHTITLFGAAAAMHTTGSAIGTAYYETKTTKNIVIPIATESTYGLTKASSITFANSIVELETGLKVGAEIAERGYISGLSFSGTLPDGVSASDVSGYTVEEVTGSITTSSGISMDNAILSSICPTISSLTISSTGRIDASFNLYNFGDRFSYSKIRITLNIRYLHK